MGRSLRVAVFRLCLTLALTLTPARAVPSIFPEDAAFVTLGYDGTVVGDVGVELVVPVRYLDVSVGLEAYAPVTDPAALGVRASGTALVFPAFGTTPPLALGLGADVGYGPDGFSVHAGPLVGTDLLFSLRLPMTASLYLAPGYATETGFSLAWGGAGAVLLGERCRRFRTRQQRFSPARVGRAGALLTCLLTW